MNKVEINAIINKRHAELECLGIAPAIYYAAIKLINRSVLFIIKDDKAYFFRNEEYKMAGNSRKKKTNSSSHDNKIMTQEISTLLIDAFGVDSVIAEKIIYEWVREKTIYIRMNENTNRYWDFISLPNHPDADTIEDEYNF